MVSVPQISRRKALMVVGGVIIFSQLFPLDRLHGDTRRACSHQSQFSVESLAICVHFIT